jgi:hypothetical protein
MRIFVVVGILASMALAAEAAISRTSPEAAVRAAYVADALALQSEGGGAIRDPIVRERLLSRSLLRAIDADEADTLALNAALKFPADPFTDGSPRLVDLTIAPASEDGGSATVAVDFARGDGAREHLTYALVMEHGEWRIDDIGYALLGGQSRTLRGMVAN